MKTRLEFRVELVIIIYADDLAMFCPPSRGLQPFLIYMIDMASHIKYKKEHDRDNEKQVL